MRFVPFARAPSSPKKIRVGSVNEEPPPAFTFINPLIAPTVNNNRSDCISNKIVPDYETKYTIKTSHNNSFCKDKKFLLIKY